MVACSRSSTPVQDHASRKEGVIHTHKQVCPSELGAVVSQPLHSYMLGSYAMTRTNEVTRLLLYLYNIYVTIGYTRRMAIARKELARDVNKLIT